MKQKTAKELDKAEQIVTRVFIDRSRKIQSAILQEKRQIVKEANVTAAYLYDYYVGVCRVPVWDLTDDAKVSKQLGLTTRKVADTRRLLTKLGWIRFDTHYYKGTKYGLWYIGKEVVKAKMDVDTEIEDFAELGILTEEEVEKIYELHGEEVEV